MNTFQAQFVLDGIAVDVSASGDGKSVGVEFDNSEGVVFAPNNARLFAYALLQAAEEADGEE